MLHSGAKILKSGRAVFFSYHIVWFYDLIRRCFDPPSARGGVKTFLIELSVDSTSVSRVENSSKDNLALPSAFLKQFLTLATILSKIPLHQGALLVKFPLYSLVL